MYFFIKKLRYKGLLITSLLLVFFSNYLYGNYQLNSNKVITAKYVKEKKFVNVKIISPNFDLKYNLSEEETLKRINNLIRYSDIEKNKKTLFIWPEGALSGKYFFELEKYKNLIKKKFF